MSNKDLRTTILEKIEDYDEGFDTYVKNGRLPWWLKSQNEVFTASQNTSEDYRDRYLLELLQNSQDAHAKAGVVGCVSIIVSDESLIVADQGCGFDSNSIEGIFFLGGGDKTAEESIGHKGLGFRSVLQLTNSPQFFQDDFSFEFNERKLVERINSLSKIPIDDGLAYLHRPFLIETLDCGNDIAEIEELKREGFKLILRFPFKPSISVSSILASILDHLEGATLLFLPNISSVTVRNHDRVIEITSTQISREELESGVLVDVLEIRAEGDSSRWQRFRKRITIDRRHEHLVAHLSKWTNVRHLDLHVAVPIDQYSEIHERGQQRLYSYFPTEMSAGLPFILDAPFYLSLNRNELHAERGAALNEFLVNELTTFFASEVCTFLAACNDTSSKLLHALAGGSPIGATGRELRTRFFDKFAFSEVIPSLNMGLVSAQQSKNCSPAFLELGLDGDSNVLSPTETPDLVLLSVQHDRQALSLIQELGSSDIPIIFELSMLKRLATHDRQMYFRALSEWFFSSGPVPEAKSLLESVESLIDVNGNWIKAHSNVFSVADERDCELPYLDSFRFIVVAEDSGRLADLLRALGIEELSEEQIVAGPIRDILQTSSERRERTQALKYLEDWRLGGQAPAKLDIDVILRCTNAKQNKFEFRDSRDLYLAHFSDSPLSVLYGWFDECDFVDMDELRDTMIEDLDGFLEFVGVKCLPKIQAIGANQTEFDIDRLEQLVECPDLRVRETLWTLLADNWNTYKDFARIPISNRDSKLRPSTFLRTLRDANWVPVADSANVEFTKPSTLWWRPSTMKEKNDVWSVVPKPIWPGGAQDDTNFVNQLRFCKLSEPSLLALIKLLTRIYGSFEGEPTRNQFGIGQWALKEIANRYTNDDVRKYRNLLKFFAKSQDQLTLDPDPLAVNDRRLELIVRATIPTLEIEQVNYQNFVERFALTEIKSSSVTSIVGLIDEGLSSQLAARVERVKSVLEEVSVKTSEEKLKETRRYFESFDYVVTNSLRLEMDVRGVSHSFEGADSYIGSLHDGRRDFVVCIPHLNSLDDIDWEPVAQDLATLLEMQSENILIFRLLGVNDFESFSREIRRRQFGSTVVPDEEAQDADEEIRAVSIEHDEEIVTAGKSDTRTQIETIDSFSGLGVSRQADARISLSATSLEGGIASPNLIEGQLRAEVSKRARRNLAQTPSELLDRAYGQVNAGAKAELYAFAYEKERVEKLGLANPNQVFTEPDHVSSRDPTSPFDIQSVDDEGRPVYIEVKGTVEQKNVAVFISSAEVEEMKKRGSSYWIFRIWDLNADPPKYLIYKEPAKMIREGRARLVPLGYQLQFGDES